MPKGPAAGAMWWSCAIFLLLSMHPSRAEWRQGELRTAAYVIDDHAFDLFFEDYDKAVRLDEAPFASRFFAAGDELWDLSASFREAKVLRGEAARAVVNVRTKRMVVRAGEEDHLRAEIMWRGFCLPEHPAVRAELLRVSCPELGAIDWNAEEIAEREKQSLLSFDGKGRFGEEFELRSRREQNEGTILARLQDAGSGVVEAILSFEAVLEENGGPVNLDMRSSLPVQGGHPVYLDLGSRNDPGTTLVLVLESEVQFSDGTPVHLGIEFERPEDQPPIVGLPESIALDHQRDTGGGQTLAIWSAPPTFVSHLRDQSQRGEDADPFGTDEILDDDEHGKAALAKLPKVYDTSAIPGIKYPEVMRDVAGLLRDVGILLAPGEWAWQSDRVASLITKSGADSFDLIDQLMMVIGSGPPSGSTRISASILEWSGPRAGAEIPADAIRRGRLAVRAQDAQEGSIQMGRRSGDAWFQAVRFEAEAINTYWGEMKALDLRVELESEPFGLSVTQSLAVSYGVPVLLPVGTRDGKNVGILLEAERVNLNGTVGRKKFEGLPE